MISDNVITALFVAIPATITAIGAAIVAVKQSNKASARTDQKVDANAAVIADKLGAVHETVNGNFTALQAKHDELARENELLRAKLSTQDHQDHQRRKKGAS